MKPSEMESRRKGVQDIREAERPYASPICIGATMSSPYLCVKLNPIMPQVRPPWLLVR